MNKHSAKKLLEMTSKFYSSCVNNFSQTRQSGWHGWEGCARVLEFEACEGERGGKSEYGVVCKQTINYENNHISNHKIASSEVPLQILDVACGNLRFERWLTREFPELDFNAMAIDSCRELVGCAIDELSENEDEALRANLDERVRFEQFDIGEWLIEHDNILKSSDVSGSLTCEALGSDFDIAVCFGFMHHIPGESARLQLLIAMLCAVKIGGFVVMSFWCFDRSKKMLSRARETTREALEYFARTGDDETVLDTVELGAGASDEELQVAGGKKKLDADVSEIELDAGDYLLGFSDCKGIYRYCHTFANEEIDRILYSAQKIVPFVQVARFSADGKTGNLNEYVILRKL